MASYTTANDRPADGRRLRVAVIGCGRMGQRHALNLHNLTPRAHLVALCDPSPAAAEWAASHLPQVPLHTDPEAVFAAADVDAVVIATITATHGPLTLRAIAAGKHVLLEKPIALDVDDARPVVAAVEASSVKVMLGFVRRFDAALQQLEGHLRGSGGKTYLLKSTTQDPYDTSGFFLQYAPHSGGIYTDCGIHDIDMARWLLREPVKSVYAAGSTTLIPELTALGDVDNALAIITFASGAQATLHLSRTGMGGYESVVEAFGTGGKAVVDTPPACRVAVTDGLGRRLPGAGPSYIDRFGDAFVREAAAFVDCVLDDTPVPTTARDALLAGLIAKALTHSLKTGLPVLFDDDGEPVLA
ncbi:hypothetical protein Q8F55_007622 [Vanrija albida]|uniref:Gfo/Idh/MocA-like oxidoreductase N-terminal domain-containing protein n=1 Tax=Vanrija albida TaxID=181172 RepID=A0ABR3PU11_9TREE